MLHFTNANRRAPLEDARLVEQPAARRPAKDPLAAEGPRLARRDVRDR